MGAQPQHRCLILSIVFGILLQATALAGVIAARGHFFDFKPPGHARGVFPDKGHHAWEALNEVIRSLRF